MCALTSRHDEHAPILLNIMLAHGLTVSKSRAHIDSLRSQSPRPTFPHRAPPAATSASARAPSRWRPRRDPDTLAEPSCLSHPFWRSPWPSDSQLSDHAPTSTAEHGLPHPPCQQLGPPRWLDRAQTVAPKVRSGRVAWVGFVIVGHTFHHGGPLPIHGAVNRQDNESIALAYELA